MPIFTYFHLDALAMLMILLVSFLGLVVGVFASKYMQGDSHYKRFFILLSFLVISLSILATADNLILMLLAWGSSNVLLILLMVHQSQWKAAYYSGLLTAKSFTIGFISLIGAFSLLYMQTGETSIQAILNMADPKQSTEMIAMILIFIAAMTQSAIWPFHRWLLSSLNSPTPVSAMMHAGLVNGGGFLLARFAPIFLANSSLLNGILILGICSAVLGTLWKLMQHDIKRMLACSTLGQMGFMLAQCGLGLFPAAIAHLCWHGLFKANLFLSSNNAAKENKINNKAAISIKDFILALIIGLISSVAFSKALEINWNTLDTRLILVGLSVITASQFSLTLLRNLSWKNFPIILILASSLSYFYGCSVYLIEKLFQPMGIFQPQSLNLIHLFSMIILVGMWCVMIFSQQIFNRKKTKAFLLNMYVKNLNASQAHPLTITSHRNDYRYTRG